MTQGQVLGFRNLWADATRKEESMTEYEMIKANGRLNRAQTICTLPDGRTFYWNQQRKLWVR